jgi:hypothetical protein
MKWEGEKEKKNMELKMIMVITIIMTDILREIII